MINKSDVRKWANRQYRATTKPTTGGRIFVITVIVVLALLYMVNRGNAQDADFAGCTAEDYATLTADVTAQLAALQDDPAAGFTALRGMLDMTQAKCTGGVFTKATQGSNIIGPFTFDGTVYQLTLTVPEAEFTYAFLQWTELEGDCDLIKSLDVPGDGGTNSGIVEFEDCSALFEVDTNADDWTVQIVKVK